MFKRYLMFLVVAMTAAGLSVLSPAPSGAATATISFSPSSVVFSTTTVLGTAERTVTVRNTGRATIQLEAVFPTGPFALAGGTCIDEEANMARNLGAGGTCTLEISYTPDDISRDSATAVITALPGQGAPGTDSETGGDGPSKNLNLRGSGGPMEASASPDPVAFGNVNISSTAVKPLTFTNTSDVPQQVVPYFHAGSPSNFSVQPPPPPPIGSPCQQPSGEGEVYAVLPPGGQCTVYLGFSPTTGASYGTIVYLDVSRSDGQVGTFRPLTHDPELTLDVVLSGKGVLPPITVSPTSHNFGNVTVGVFKTFVFTVKNNSTGQLEFWPDPIGGPFSASGTGGGSSCVTTDGFGLEHPAVVPAKGSCTLQVTYFPHDLGKETRILAVGAYNPEQAPPGSSGPQGDRVATDTVQVSGNAIGPTFSSPTNLAFGDVTVGTRPEKIVTLTNTSPRSVQFWPGPHGEEVFTASAYGGVDPCAAPDISGMVLIPVDVGPGESCTIAVSFDARSTGPKNGNVVVDVYGFGDFTGPGGPKLASRTIPVTGTGVLPTFTVDPSRITFRPTTVGAVRTTIVTVTNTSQRALAFDAAGAPGTVFNASAYAADDDACARYPFQSPVPEIVTVFPGQSCTLSVSFAPLATGSARGSFTVSAHAPVEMFEPLGPALSSKSFQVSGGGIAPTIKATPTTVKFGGVSVGGFATRTVSVTNTSGIPLEMWGAPVGEGSRFYITQDEGSGGCAQFSPGGSQPVTVYPGQSCLMQVVFIPQSGPSSATLKVQAYGGSDFSGPTGPVLATATVKATGTGTR